MNVSNTLSEWKKTLTILNHVVYTGYPNSIGPLTIQGSIMGFDPSGIMYIQSYAWSGSSGSGVFDQSGNLIGYILATTGYIDKLRDIKIICNTKLS